MVNWWFILGFALIFNGCGQSFWHWHHVGSDVVVRDTFEQLCFKSYSQFDLDKQRWLDFYGEPCSVFIERKATRIHKQRTNQRH